MTPRRSRVAARVAALLLVLCFASGQPPGAQSHEQQSLGAQPQEQQSAGSPATARLVSSTTVPGSPGVFSESYDAALPPAPPGAVQLLFFPFSRPPGSVAVLGLSLELVDTASRAPVPPSQLYVHHYGVDERAGAELANATNWAERLAAGASFWAGPCTSVSYTLGAGAEFRGPNPQLPPWAAGSPLPTAAWRLAPDSDYSIEFHMIDLRQVCGWWGRTGCLAARLSAAVSAAGLSSRVPAAGIGCPQLCAVQLQLLRASQP